MLVMKNIKLLIILSLLSVEVFAGGIVSDATITKIISQGANSKGVDRVCIYIGNPIANSPSCNTSNRFCAELDSPLGNAAMSMALLAYTTDQKVYISGKNTCNQVSNSEDIDVIALEK